MSDSNLLKLDITTLSNKISSKEISPTEITYELLNRIENINPEINAFITVAAEEAVEQAKQAETEIAAGRYRGPLHGVPIGLKDLIYTKGIKTTMGSGVYKDFIPDADAAVVQKLKQAGAVIIGKLNTHEFAYGSTGDISYFGAVRNPYDTSKMTGGSSSGSGAAVAAALCFGALGTDTGGSIRIPASACGIVGMKPTFGRVSKHGVYPLAHTLDHVGPMTRTVRDNAMLLGILAGYDHGDPYSVRQAGEDFTRYLGDSIRGKVIGIPSSFYFDHIEDEVKNKIDEAIALFRSLGAEVRTVDIAGLSEISWAQLKTIQSEAYAVHEKLLAANADKYHPEVLERFQVSAEAKGYEYVKAQDIRRRVQESFRCVFESVDVLVTPTIPTLPPDIGQRGIDINGQNEPVRAALLRLTGPTNITGLPSMSIPCGFSKTGLPIGLQLIGGAFNEALLYQFAAAFEKEASISTLKWENK
jgi:aspartyl-tRNA(Asn)/glutamyl-tRNA(Gln) amidotransferase subunit A